MSEERINKLVPKLRFPEFRDSGDWEEKTLGEIGEFIGGGTPDTTIQEYWDGEIQWFTPTEVKERNFKKSNRTITAMGLKNSSAKLLPKGALLITTRATIGDIGIAYDECTTNQGFQSLIVNKSEINIFWYYYIRQNKKELVKKSSGSTFPEIGKNEILKVKAIRPTKDEQQKIADCLSSLDDLITAQKQKLEALKTHKKGLMQQLFPAEGETVPKLRFAEFKREWISGKVGDLVETVMGNAFSSSDFVEEGAQLIRMGNLYQGKLDLNRSPVFLPINFDQEYSRSLVKPLDLLMSMTGTVGKRDYGFIVQIPKDCPLLFLNQRVLKIVPKVNCISEFSLQLLKSDSFLEQLYSRPGGTKQANLSVQQLIDIKVTFPNLDEQQKIADCLSSLDELISAQKEKIETLKVHKKGLMQQLFPNINE